MDVTTALRKVKRQFGDEYNVVIVDEDIYYWIHEAELDIIRQTASNDIKIMPVANTFPATLPSNVIVKRVSCNGKALVFTSRNELDATVQYLTTEGTPIYWYWENNQVQLYPSPKTSDTFTVEVIYCKVPAEMEGLGPHTFTVPEVFHEDVVKYCIARAHNKNMNWKAAESEMEAYDRNVSSRRNEVQSVDVPLYKEIDPTDYDWVD
jgi:hypothetical protein